MPLQYHAHLGRTPCALLRAMCQSAQACGQPSIGRPPLFHGKAAHTGNPTAHANRRICIQRALNYLEYVVTDEDRDPTEQEMREIQKKRQAMYEECMKEGL